MTASVVAGETPIGTLDWITGGAFAYTVVLTVFASYVLFFWLLQTYPASQVSAFTFLAPIFAVLAGHVLLGEPVTWRVDRPEQAAAIVVARRELSTDRAGVV